MPAFAENVMRNDRMRFPSQRWPTDLSRYDYEGESIRERFVVPGPGARSGERDFLMRYMLDTFYRQAPIPKTLRLADTLKEGSSFLEEEIGTSQVLR